MIVVADIELLRQLEPLGNEFAVECNLESWAGGPFNWTHFAQTWGGLIRSGIGKIFVLLSAGKPSGAIGLVMFTDPLTGLKLAQEAFWFVSNVNRGAGVRLLRFAEKWCSTNGVRQLYMMALAHLHSKELGELYQRMGYIPMEHVYRKRFVWQQ